MRAAVEPALPGPYPCGWRSTVLIPSRRLLRWLEVLASSSPLAPTAAAGARRRSRASPGSCSSLRREARLRPDVRVDLHEGEADDDHEHGRAGERDRARAAAGSRTRRARPRARGRSCASASRGGRRRAAPTVGIQTASRGRSWIHQAAQSRSAVTNMYEVASGERNDRDEPPEDVPVPRVVDEVLRQVR